MEEEIQTAEGSGAEAGGSRTSPEYVADAMETTTLRLLRRLLDVADQSARTAARRADLSHHELLAMQLLAHRALGPGELARHLGVTSAAGSGIVDRLVTRGHVRREPHEEDRRRTQVVVTDGGRAAIVRQLLPMFLALDELDRDLTPEHRVIVDHYLEGVIAAIERVG